MIEETLLNYLKSKIPEVAVAMEVLNDDEVIVIEKTGSDIDTYINRATFAIQSYAASLYDAALLNEKVKTAMLGDGMTTEGFAELDEICNCDINSDYNFTDTTTKRYRYQAVFEVAYY